MNFSVSEVRAMIVTSDIASFFSTISNQISHLSTLLARGLLETMLNKSNDFKYNKKEQNIIRKKRMKQITEIYIGSNLTRCFMNFDQMSL